jgi:hypothetical protein
VVALKRSSLPKNASTSMEAAMQHITKLCADSLRALVNHDSGNKLGSAHAHELVAAYFGYRSKAALLADTVYPLDKLKEAEFFVSPSLDILYWRVKSLMGDLPALPNAPILAKCVYSVLVAEKWISGTSFSSAEKLVTHAAKEVLHRRWIMWGMNPASIKMDIDVKIESNESGIESTVFFSYMTSGSAPERLRDSTVSVKVPRVAANLGFGKAESYETRYTAGARKMDFPDDIVWPAMSPQI